jgi:cytochrome d ubiquinol oxidase subunit II
MISSAIATIGSVAAVATGPSTINPNFMNPTTFAASPWQVLWFLLIAVVTIGYFVLDGFDLGAGIIYPFIAKTDAERKVVRRSIGPVWDGNEVWLLTSGGALFAAFAPAYATTFSGFYLAIMLVLFGLIARAAAVELRSKDNAWKKLWDGAFFIGSLVPALLFGAAIGNVLMGIPMDMQGNYVGIHLIGLLRPFPLLCGIVGLTTMMVQGASWIAQKAPKGSELQQRAAKCRRPILIINIVVMVLATLLYWLPLGPATILGAGAIAWNVGMPQRLIQIVFCLVWVIAVVGALIAQAKGSDLMSFLCISLAPFGLVGITAASLFPFMVPSTGPGPSLSVASAGGSDVALMAMTIIACIGVPLVLIYHIIAYRTFRGRLEMPQEDQQ